MSLEENRASGNAVGAPSGIDVVDSPEPETELWWCSVAPVEARLQASTSEVYGDPDVHPQTEEYWGRVNPIGARSCIQTVGAWGNSGDCVPFV